MDKKDLYAYETYALLFPRSLEESKDEGLEDYLRTLIDRKIIGVVYETVFIKSEDEIEEVLGSGYFKDDERVQSLLEDNELEIPYKFVRVRVLDDKGFSKCARDFRENFDLFIKTYETL